MSGKGVKRTNPSDISKELVKKPKRSQNDTSNNTGTALGDNKGVGLSKNVKHIAANVKGTGARVLDTDFFDGVNIYILPTGIERVRRDLFKRQVEKFGGCYKEKFEVGVTHIIIDDKIELLKMCKLMKLDKVPAGVKILKSLWLSTCIKKKVLEATEDFEVKDKHTDLNVTKSYIQSSELSSSEKTMTVTQDVKETSGMTDIKIDNKTMPVDKNEEKNVQSNSEENINNIKTQIDKYVPKPFLKDDNNSDPDSDYLPSDEDAESETVMKSSAANNTSKRRFMPRGNWVCAHSSKTQPINYNQHITDKLQALAQTYENTNDKWRALGYQKAIMTLKRHPKKITTWEEAKALPGVGSRLADKIWEIAESGELRKLNELSSQEEVKALNIFTNIWGAGAQTARQWVQQGFRTLDDIRTKAKLNRNQKIGLKYYDELLDRMSREEATQIGNMVKEAALTLQPGLIVMTCGSYRRGKPTCGDVDVLITHPDGHSHKGIFSILIQKLHDTVVVDVVVNEPSAVEQAQFSLLNQTERSYIKRPIGCGAADGSFATISTTGDFTPDILVFK